MSDLRYFITAALAKLILPLAIGRQNAHMPFIDLRPNNLAYYPLGSNLCGDYVFYSSRHRQTRKGFVLEPPQIYDVKGKYPCQI